MGRRSHASHPRIGASHAGCPYASSTRSPTARVGRYYDVHRISNMRHELTILAYEMNGAPVSVLHGAPYGLRCENELGFKMVKWIAAIEFVHDFADLGAGQADIMKIMNSNRLPDADLSGTSRWSRGLV